MIDLTGVGSFLANRLVPLEMVTATREPAIFLVKRLVAFCTTAPAGVRKNHNNDAKKALPIVTINNMP